MNHNIRIITPWNHGFATSFSKTIPIPPDKSVTHRSIIFASLSKGESLILNPLLSEDCLSTIDCFRKLGVLIDIKPDKLTVSSPGMDQFTSPLLPLNFGNSGTTARLLTGLLSGIPNLFVTAFGDASLTSRPMGRVTTPLKKNGAHIIGRQDSSRLPLALTGTSLKSAAYHVDKASAQVKSALLLSALSSDGTTTIILPRGSRNHTELMLKSLGANISWLEDSTLETIQFKGPFRPSPQTYHVGGDPSSAAFIASLAILSQGKVTLPHILNNPTRTGFFKVIERMGVKVSYTPVKTGCGEPCVDITVFGQGGQLKPVTVSSHEVPSLIDEIPILAVLARFADGVSRFEGVGELRVKESDRLESIKELIELSGIKTETPGDTLIIHGNHTLSQPFTFSPRGDHRLAMAASVLGHLTKAPSKIMDPECVAISFPGFFDLAGEIR